MATIEEIEARRAERKAKQDEARAEQYAKDLEALDALEAEHGEAVARLDLKRYAPGHPTFVVLKAPKRDVYKRFCDMVARAKDSAEQRMKAQNMLAESCWVYPTDAGKRAEMLEDFPGLLLSIAISATQLVEGQAAAEGKD